MKKSFTWRALLGFLLGFSTLNLAVAQAPANDNLCNAAPLTLNAGCSGPNGDNTNATAEPGEPRGSCWIGPAVTTSVWYSFVGPSTGLVNLTTDDANGGFAGTNDDTQLTVYTLPAGSPCSDLTALVQVGCNEDISFSNWRSAITALPVTPGATYYVQVSGYAGLEGTFCLRVDSTQAFTPPVNDDLCDAMPLVLGASCNNTFNGDNSGATLQPGEPIGACFSTNTTTTVWYSFVAPASGIVRITTEPGPTGGFAGTNEDTQIALYQLSGGATCADPDSLVEIACNDDTPFTPGFLSTIDNQPVLAGLTYYVQVSGFDNEIGTFCIRVEDLGSVVRPANDTLCNATPLVVGAGCNGSFNGDNTNATLEPFEEIGSCFLTSSVVTVWYSFVAPSTGLVVISTDSANGGFAGTNDDTQLAVYSLPAGSTCAQIGDLVEIGCNEDIDAVNNNYLSEIFGLAVTPGETYYVQVSGYLNTQGTFCLRVDSLQPGSNDDVCNAIALPVDGSVAVYNNIGATVQPGEDSLLKQPAVNDPTDASGWIEPNINNSVWFTFVGPASGVVEIDLCGPGLTDFDTQVAIYTVGNCNDFSTFTFVAANDDLADQCQSGSDIWSSRLETCVTPGQTYYILVDGFELPAGPEEGTFGIRLTEITTPIAPLTASLAVTPPNCPTDQNGVINLVPSGGYSPYSISWSSGQSGSTLTSLPQGVYAYTLTDVCGTTISDSALVFAPELKVSVVADSPLCANSPLQLVAEVTGGKRILSDALFGVDLGTGNLVRMKLNDPGNSAIVSGGLIQTYFGADFAFNVLFMLANNNNVVAVDPNTANFNLVGNAVKQAGHTWTGLAFNPASSSMFGLSTNGQVSQLYSINVGNGSATPLVQLTGANPFVPIWLAINNQGEMYTLDIAADALYKIDPTSGVVTLVGPIGFNTSFAQDADFDPTTNQLYAGIFDPANNNTQLRHINTTTGASTLIGLMGSGVSEMGGLAIRAETVQPFIYSWNLPGVLNNPNSGSPKATLAGDTTLIVTVADACGSLATDTIRLDLNVISLALSTTPNNGTNNGTATATVTGGVPPYVYVWSNGDSTATITGLDSIKYSVVVTDALGCVVSGEVMVESNVSIDDLKLAGIQSARAFPNPSTGAFRLEIKLDRAEQLEIRIYDMNGRIVETREMQGADFFAEDIRLKQAAAGMYQISLITPRGAGSLRIVVR